MEQNEQERSLLLTRFREILGADVYIYGAGIVGKRLYHVIKQHVPHCHVNGFVVSHKQTAEAYEELPLFSITEISPPDSQVIVAVGDEYQNQIYSILAHHGFTNVINGYRYSFLDSDYIPEALPEEVPQVISIDIRELMLMQFMDGVFQAYDILLGIEYVGRESQDDSVNGQIVVDANLRICHGRSCVRDALIKDRDYVNILQDCSLSATGYDYSWLCQNVGMKTARRLKKNLERLKKDWQQPFMAIIWPPACQKLTGIKAEIAACGTIIDNYKIIMPQAEMKGFIKAVYGTDDTEPKIIADKIRRLTRGDGCQRVAIIEYTLGNPGFYIKRYGHTVSKQGITLKNAIRSKYKNAIDDYVYDVIIHTTDNYEQAGRLKKIIARYGQCR